RQGEGRQDGAGHGQGAVFGFEGVGTGQQDQQRPHGEAQRDADVRGAEPAAPAPQRQQGQRPGRPEEPGQVAQDAAPGAGAGPVEGIARPEQPAFGPVGTEGPGGNPPEQDQRDRDQGADGQPVASGRQGSAGQEDQGHGQDQRQAAQPAARQERQPHGHAQGGGARDRMVEHAGHGIEGQGLAGDHGGHFGRFVHAPDDADRGHDQPQGGRS